MTILRLPWKFLVTKVINFLATGRWCNCLLAGSQAVPLSYPPDPCLRLALQRYTLKFKLMATGA